MIKHSRTTKTVRQMLDVEQSRFVMIFDETEPFFSTVFFVESEIRKKGMIESRISSLLSTGGTPENFVAFFIDFAA